MVVALSLFVAGCDSDGDEVDAVAQDADTPGAMDFRSFGVSVADESLWVSGGIALYPEGWVGLPEVVEVDATGQPIRRLQLPHSDDTSFFEFSKVVEVGGEVWVLGTQCTPPPMDDDTLGCTGEQVFRLFRMVGDSVEQMEVELPGLPNGEVRGVTSAVYGGNDGQHIYLRQGVGFREDGSSVVRLLRLDPASGSVAEVPVPDGLFRAAGVCVSEAGVVAAVPDISFDSAPVTAIDVVVAPADSGEWLPIGRLPLSGSPQDVHVECSGRAAAVAVTVIREGTGPSVGVDVTVVVGHDSPPALGPTQQLAGLTSLHPCGEGFVATPVLEPRLPDGEPQVQLWVSDANGSWLEAEVPDGAEGRSDAEGVCVGDQVVDLHVVTSSVLDDQQSGHHEPGG